MTTPREEYERALTELHELQNYIQEYRMALREYERQEMESREGVAILYRRMLRAEGAITYDEPKHPTA